MNINEGLLKQIYERYLQVIQEDKDAKISQVLKEEPFVQIIAQQKLSERDIEAAIFDKLYAEEESADIQQMIAQFYNKFDELHE